MKAIPPAHLCCCGGQRFGEYIPVSALEGIMLGCGAPGPMVPSGPIPGSCLRGTQCRGRRAG